MKIDRLETHDRLNHFKKDQELNIFKGAEDCLNKNPLSLALQEKSSYVYIFAHPRTHDDGVTKVMYWQPRLTRPEAQTNSYLFRVISKTDVLEICWLIPPQETWLQYKKGKVTESEWVTWSIQEFIKDKKKLGSSLKDDVSEEVARNIYLQIAREMEEQIKIDKIKLKT